MSATCSSFHLYLPVTTSRPVIKHVNKVLMLKNNHVPGKKSSAIRIRSFSENKVFEDQSEGDVFEDQSEGVICYRDENGEIVCEGYDEGPRFPKQIHGTFYHLRDAELLDLFQERWLQIVNGGGFNNANEGVFVVEDDFNWNDFNKFW